MKLTMATLRMPSRGQSLLLVLFAITLLGITLSGTLKIMETMNRGMRDIVGDLSFEARSKSLKRILSHDASCKKILLGTNLSSLFHEDSKVGVQTNASTARENPYSSRLLVKLTFGGNEFTKESNIENLKRTVATLSEPDPTKRIVCGGLTKYAINVEFYAEKDIFVGTRNRLANTLVYLTAGADKVVVNCSGTQGACSADNNTNLVSTEILFSQYANNNDSNPNNCGALFDGAGTFIHLGCNKDRSIRDKPITIQADPANCNVLRVILYGGNAKNVPVSTWPPTVSGIGLIHDTSWLVDIKSGKNEVAKTRTGPGYMFFTQNALNTISGLINDDSNSTTNPTSCQDFGDYAFYIKFPTPNYTIQNSGLACGIPSSYSKIPCY